jgi:hypothetical protein
MSFPSSKKIYNAMTQSWYNSTDFLLYVNEIVESGQLREDYPDFYTDIRVKSLLRTEDEINDILKNQT